jgi:hypothetical protein
VEIRTDRQASDEQILAMLADSTFSLQAVAEANGLTLVALARWAERPDIRAAIRALRRLHEERARLLAADAAATAVNALSSLCSSMEHEERRTLDSPDPRQRATRARNRETLRKCSTQLLHLAHPKPRPPTRKRARPAPMPPTSPSELELGNRDSEHRNSELGTQHAARSTSALEHGIRTGPRPQTQDSRTQDPGPRTFSLTSPSPPAPHPLA